MKVKKLLEPKLRFNEFQDEWKKFKLGELVNFLDEKRKPIKDSDRNKFKGIYPYYGASGIIDYVKEYIFDQDTILLGEDGANILARSTRLAFIATGKYWVNNHAHVLEPKESNIYFLCELLESLKYEQYNTGTAQPKLNQEVCKNIEIIVPSIIEQEKIGKFLILLNKKIELQKQKIEALKIYKKGLLSKLYYTKNGEKTKISDILEEVVDKSVVNNQYNVISSTKEDLVLQREYFNKKIASENNIGYKILKKYQIVFSPQNLWMGNINYNEKYNIGIVSPSYKVFNIKAGYDKNYIANLLKTPRAIYYYMINSEQGASIVRRNLNMETFYEISFNIPSINEQIKIGSIIRKICLKIDNEEMCLKQLERLKKGLLQKMFI